MGSNYDNHDAVNDVIRLTTRCKASYSEWVQFRNIVEDEGTDHSYQRMLGIIMGKAGEHLDRESDDNVISTDSYGDNSNGAGGLHVKREAGASGSQPKPKLLTVEKSESPLDKNHHGSSMRGLHISEPDRIITNRSSRKQNSGLDHAKKSWGQNCGELKGKSAVEEDSEDTKAVVPRINNSSAKGGHCMCGAPVRPSNKDKVRGQVEFGRVYPGQNSTLLKSAAKDHFDDRNVEVGPEENSTHLKKSAAKDHLDDGNAEVGPGENSSLFRKRAAKDLDRNAKVGLGKNSTFFNKYAAKDYLDHNVNAESSRKILKHREIRNAKAESTDETDDDVAILEDNGFLENLRSFAPSKRFHNSMEEDADFRHLGRSSSSKSASDGFREEVLDVLGQPFDEHELKRLRETVRNGSYYNHYPDLESKLKRCRYKRGKCLNILRGFFFWLQNVSREGAFKPWKDGQCLAVELASP